MHKLMKKKLVKKLVSAKKTRSTRSQKKVKYEDSSAQIDKEEREMVKK